MNKPIKHHVISRFYLENFAKNGTLYIYDLEKKEIRPASSESICNENNFYVGQIEGQDIESKLAENESKVAPLVKELIYKRDLSLLSEEDRRNFALFVSLTHVRVRPFLDNMGVVMVAHEEGQLFESEENLRSALMQSRERELERSVILEEPFIWNYANILADKIMQMNWSLFVADSNLSFFTSDNPVCFHSEPNPAKKDDVPLKKALDDSSIRVVLPLSPEVCWIGYWSDNSQGVYNADKGWVESFNTQRCKWVDRFLIASEEKQEILEMGMKFKGLKLYTVKT